MKWRNSYAIVAGCTAASLMASNVQAQSSFAGFYGQVSTGYESNQLGSLSGTGINTPNQGTDVILSAPSQTFGGTPLVLGIGYYWQATDKWLIGLGADYSAINQTSPAFQLTAANAPGSTAVASGENATFNGGSVQLSNRFNLFITPAYAIDKDKLVYVKAGYSQVTAQYNQPTSLTRIANGVSTTTAAKGGSQSSNQGGYLIGLGYKQIITSGLYGFVEANYMGYSAPSYSYSTYSPAAASLSRSASTRTVSTSFASLNSYQALIGLGYAF
jgi:hypothetical protein